MDSTMDAAQPDLDWQSTQRTVSQRTRHMFNNPDMSDISFTCEGSETFYAHKYVLATSSVVFHAMFYGALAEKNPVLHLSDTDEKSLGEFLRFLYTDECDLTPDNIISILYLSKKYIVPSLTEYLIAQLIRDMEPANVLNILEQAIQFEEKDLENKCWQFVEWRASEVIVSETFNIISEKTLAGLLKRNNLNVSEVKLFHAVLKWSESQCSQKSLDPTTENRRSALGVAVYDLRLLAMGQEEFAKHVSKSGLLSTEELVPIYEKFNKLESPSLKWTLPERERTFNATKDKIRISRFSKSKMSTNDHCTPWPHASRQCYDYDYNYGCEYSNEVAKSESDFLSFSVDQYALFIGVRLFGNPIVNSQSNPSTDKRYDATLIVNGKSVASDTYEAKNERGIDGFDVIIKSPILVKKDEVVEMGAMIRGSSTQFGLRGKAKVKVNGITVTFLDTVGNGRTCVSQGQFHEIILSV